MFIITCHDINYGIIHRLSQIEIDAFRRELGSIFSQRKPFIFTVRFYADIARSNFFLYEYYIAFADMLKESTVSHEIRLEADDVRFFDYLKPALKNAKVSHIIDAKNVAIRGDDVAFFSDLYNAEIPQRVEMNIQSDLYNKNRFALDALNTNYHDRAYNFIYNIINNKLNNFDNLNHSGYAVPLLNCVAFSSSENQEKNSLFEKPSVFQIIFQYFDENWFAEKNIEYLHSIKALPKSYDDAEQLVSKLYGSPSQVYEVEYMKQYMKHITELRFFKLEVSFAERIVKESILNDLECFIHLMSLKFIMKYNFGIDVSIDLFSHIAYRDKAPYLKKVYKQYAFKAHPDKGGSTEAFQKLQEIVQKNDSFYKESIYYALEKSNNGIILMNVITNSLKVYKDVSYGNLVQLGLSGSQAFFCYTNTNNGFKMIYTSLNKAVMNIYDGEYIEAASSAALTISYVSAMSVLTSQFPFIAAGVSVTSTAYAGYHAVKDLIHELWDMGYTYDHHPNSSEDL